MAECRPHCPPPYVDVIPKQCTDTNFLQTQYVSPLAACACSMRDWHMVAVLQALVVLEGSYMLCLQPHAHD